MVRSKQGKAALKSCGTLFVPNHRPVPELAYWTGRRPKDISLGVPGPGALYVGPTTPEVAKLSILDPRDPRPVETFPPGKGPPGYRIAERNRSWILWAGCAPS